MIIVNTFPQKITPVKSITREEVIAKLPKRLKWKLNFYISGKLARDGKTAEALIFLVEQEDEPSVEMRMFFEKLFEPYPATVLEQWRRFDAIRIYNKGRLIIDPKTMCFTELPSPIFSPSEITAEEIKKRLPKEVPFKYSLKIVGGMESNGWSRNDVDFITFDTTDGKELKRIAKYFSDVLKCKVEVGCVVMEEREPIHSFELYKDGKCQLP